DVSVPFTLLFAFDFVCHIFLDAHRCRADDVTALFTVPNSRVVYVCAARFVDRFAVKTADGELLMIHELLHTLGLGENPPKSSEITAVVRRRLRVIANGVVTRLLDYQISPSTKSSLIAPADRTTVPFGSTMADEPCDTRSPARPATSARITHMRFSTAVATSTRLASSTSFAPPFAGGNPLFVGTKSAVAPRAAICFASSGKLESWQMTIPNVRPPTSNTGSSWPA